MEKKEEGGGSLSTYIYTQFSTKIKQMDVAEWPHLPPVLILLTEPTLLALSLDLSVKNKNKL